MEYAQELAAIEQASRRTAKAALRYQNQTDGVNKKIQAVGVITKSVDDRLTLISNVDEREFETLTGVIDGQVDLSKQATALSKQWQQMMAHQIAELDQLQRVNATLKTEYQNKVAAIEDLHQLAEKNHNEYMATLDATNADIDEMNVKIGLIDTREHISQITILVNALNTKLDQEKQEQRDLEAQMSSRMSDLRKVSRLLLASAGHYTNVLQTVNTKVKHMVELVDVLDEKVSQLTPASNSMTESDIIDMFSSLSQPDSNDDDVIVDTPNVDTDDNEGITDEAIPELINTDEEDHDDTDEQTLEVSTVPPRSKRSTEKEDSKSKWKFWTK